MNLTAMILGALLVSILLGLYALLAFLDRHLSDSDLDGDHGPRGHIVEMVRVVDRREGRADH